MDAGDANQPAGGRSGPLCNEAVRLFEFNIDEAFRVAGAVTLDSSLGLVAAGAEDGQKRNRPGRRKPGAV
jgi:hypothetical protein